MAPVCFIILSGILFSVVQASVINVNVFDEDKLVKAAGTLSDCNLQQCDEMCRRLGLSGGSCVAGTCYCLSIKEYTKAVIENEASEINDNYLSEVGGGCSPRACEQLCRRLGFPGGTCVNGKCDCDRFKDHTKAVIENEASEMNELISDNYHSEVGGGCSPRACEQLCKRLGFPGGTCVNGKCDCDRFKDIMKSVIENEASEINELINDNYLSEVGGGCSPRACEQLCRRLGFPGGTCVNGKCDCDRFKDKKWKSSLQPLGCNILKCNLSCIRHGHKGGICLSGACECI